MTYVICFTAFENVYFFLNTLKKKCLKTKPIEINNESNQDIGELVVKRGRGRPKTQTPLREKRPRGRPRKDKLWKETGARGRPKNKKLLKSLSRLRLSIGCGRFIWCCCEQFKKN